MYRTYRFDGKVVVIGDLFDVAFPITKETLFKLDIFPDRDAISWEDIERYVASVWMDYAPDYPRLTGRKDEGNGLRKIIPAAPYAKLMKDLIAAASPFISSGQHWADLCCGRGRTIDFMLDYNPSLRFDAIDKFSILAPHLHKMENVTYFDQDIAVYLRTVPKSSLDGIISNMGWVYAMSHTSADGGMYVGKKAAKMHLECIFNTLKPGATFVFSSPRRDVNFTKVFFAAQPYLWKFWNWIPERNFRPWSGVLVLNHAKKLAKIGKAGLFHFYSPEEFTAILKDVGFVNIYCRESFAGQDLVFTCQRV